MKTEGCKETEASPGGLGADKRAWRKERKRDVVFQRRMERRQKRSVSWEGETKQGMEGVEKGIKKWEDARWDQGNTQTLWGPWRN